MCAGRLGHFKKKFQLTKNLLLVLRQDLPKMNFGVVPSPEIQLEHVVRSFEYIITILQSVLRSRQAPNEHWCIAWMHVF